MSIVLGLIILAAGCGQPNANTDNAEDIGEWSIAVEVVGETTVQITNEDALKIGPVEIIAAQKEKDTFLEAQTWKGILMHDLLKYVGVQEFTVLSVEAVDGFSQEFDPSEITGTTGLGWMVEGEMLDEESGPIEVIADQRGPKHWVKQVSKIVIIK